MINIFKLNKNRDEKEISKYNTFRKVLEKCHSRIKLNSNKSITHCFYTIPNVILGLPTYDQIKCAEYCIDRLRKNGFVVVYTYPNLLYISWEHVPSAIKNPEVKTMEVEIQTNPYKDYSNIVCNLNNNNTIDYLNNNLIEYNNVDDDNKSQLSTYSKYSAVSRKFN